MKVFDDMIRSIERLGDETISDNTLHIAYGVDKKYVFPMGLSMTSVLKHNPHAVFHLFVDEVSLEDRQRIIATMEKYHSQCHIYYLNTEALASLPTTKVWSVAMYFRIVAAAYLSSRIDKVLYLDADTFCRADISGVYFEDINEYYTAAVEDRFPTAEMYDRARKKLDLGSCKSFNSGVMIINLKKWGGQHLSEKAIHLLMTNPEKWKDAPDQDVLNYICKGHVKWLPCWYNLFRAHDEEVQRVAEKGKIIHFIGPKPWLQWYLTETVPAMDKEYNQSHDESAWSDVPYWEPKTVVEYRLMSKRCLWDKRFINMLHWQIRYLLRKFNLR